jgi:hypothetical protein
MISSKSNLKETHKICSLTADLQTGAKILSIRIFCDSFQRTLESTSNQLAEGYQHDCR